MKLSELMSAQALRSSVNLEPIDGPGGRIFPPTYPAAEGANDKKARHVVEEHPDGRRVLIDSVASQANRQEAALAAARAAGTIDFADVYVDLSRTDAAAEVYRLSATEMPHRLSDAILRDSEFDGTPFGKSELGRRILGATTTDLTALLETSPTTVLFGCWFSQHGLAKQLRIQRSVTSEIWAENAVLGKVVGSRIDPLAIEKLDLYESTDGDWTAIEAKALMSKGKPKVHAKTKKPSEANHGNIAPSIRDQGITATTIVQRWAMPLAALRRLRFGGGKRDAAGQAYVAALGIVARVLDHEAGYSLRSRCDLISKGPITIDVIDRDGVVTALPLNGKGALALLHQAEDGMRSAGLSLHQKLEAKPGQKLIDLIAANRRKQELSADTTDGEVAA
jgi:CRISPR-associated protein Csb1